ncbi:MAG TPA: peptidase M14 [Devosia sp.]|nr:peptidase M14 [Devosia sp.]
MSLIHQARFERTLDQLLIHCANSGAASVEAWTFDDAESRRQAEAQLAALGVTARIRSSYKPLLHWFLEEIEIETLQSVQILYPRHHGCGDNRFLLEAYPLGALLGDATLSFAPSETDSLLYQVTLLDKQGRSSSHDVFAPNRLHTDFVGEELLSPTGWLVLDGQQGTRLETDYEQVFEAAIAAVALHDWGSNEPYFEELNLAVTLPNKDCPIACGEEAISLGEALHEDLYFSLLELFQKRSGRPLGDRGLQPGQIVPMVRYAPGPLTLRIETRALATTDQQAEFQPLAEAVGPLSAAQVGAELTKIEGQPFAAQSRSGRAIEGRYHPGADRAVMISGGQHPNETTGIVGALRAAQALALRPQAHFTISPLENPDGYQVHWRLRADNPAHMHHAARYTALGDDLEYRSAEPLWEKAIRVEAERLSGAKLHLNLHGYPAHEWTRPLSGYVPRNFAMWTLPKGYFLIIRHHIDWQQTAKNLTDRVTARLAEIPGLVDANRKQIALYETHAGATGFQVINGFPCLISVDERHSVPLTLITEYPDETIYGQAFITGHNAQTAFVLAAYDAYQALDLG